MASYTQVSQPMSSTPPDTTDAREWVRTALGRMERGERNALEEMREALCALVTALKAEGASQAEALRTVRGIVSEPLTEEGAFRLLPSAREALVELSIYWCSEAYQRA